MRLLFAHTVKNDQLYKGKTKTHFYLLTFI